MEVNKIRKKAGVGSKVLALSVEVLTKWRDILLAKPEGKRALSVEKDENAKVDHDDGNQTTIKKESPSSTAAKSRKESIVKGVYTEDFLVGDSVRDKCFEMLLTSLTMDSPSSEAPDELTLTICRTIEKCLYAEFNNTDSAYKAKFRSRYLNLRDKGSTMLRQSLLTGAITPERFVTMNTQEMASDERRQADQQLMETNLREAKAAQDNEAETEQFKCGRCKQRRTKYYQLQTRSADEPMTTFVTCINCNNKWKFC